jgi:hypothetical protein
MPRTRPPYPPELRRRLVELVRAGQTPEELARKFEAERAAILNAIQVWPTNTRIRIQPRRDHGCSPGRKYPFAGVHLPDAACPGRSGSRAVVSNLLVRQLSPHRAGAESRAFSSDSAR